MAGNRLYVGNIPYSTTEEELVRIFSQVGPVARATVITDRDTGRSRGFAFVEMGNDDDAQKAIQSLDGTDMAGRQLQVNIARPREERGGGDGGGGGGGGRRDGGGGFRGGDRGGDRGGYGDRRGGGGGGGGRW